MVETLTAFANTKGGDVLVGVSDAGEIVGVTVQSETMQSWITQGGMAVTVFKAIDKASAIKIAGGVSEGV